MLYKSNNATYSNNAIIDNHCLDDIDFGEVVPSSLRNLESDLYKSESFYSDASLEFDLKEQFAQAEHARQIEIIQLQGEIKTEHIQEAQDDSDLVRVKSGPSEEPSK